MKRVWSVGLGWVLVWAAGAWAQQVDVYTFDAERAGREVARALDGAEGVLAVDPGRRGRLRVAIEHGSSGLARVREALASQGLSEDPIAPVEARVEGRGLSVRAQVGVEGREGLLEVTFEVGDSWQVLDVTVEVEASAPLECSESGHSDRLRGETVLPFPIRIGADVPPGDYEVEVRVAYHVTPRGSRGRRDAAPLVLRVPVRID